MLRPLFLQILLSLCLFAAPGLTAEPVRLILDTDMGNDVDDAFAVAMIHALQNRGEVQLLAVTITKDNRFAAPFIDLMNTFYGRPDIPVGMVHDGKAPEDAPMLKVPATRLDKQGKYVYPHRLPDGSQAPEAVQLLTRILTGQPDQSVTIAQIGFSTNLARLAASPGGSALIKRKVKLLCLMAGNFVKPQPEFNVFTDAAAFERLMKDWPSPMIFSGFEVGLKIRFPYEAIQKDMSYVPHHPVVDAFHLYVGKPEDHPNWDSTAVLEAIRPNRGYFRLSAPGRVRLGEKNTTVFVPDPAGNCRYLIVKPDQVDRVRELISLLVSEPPRRTM
ncbi:MAG TPA: nucleoside hydrolase [Bryobacteraceae bacterium]|nr:nucleoside hydrolase [Bryobacteraceae bacterium]